MNNHFNKMLGALCVGICFLLSSSGALAHGGGHGGGWHGGGGGWHGGGGGWNGGGWHNHGWNGGGWGWGGPAVIFGVGPAYYNYGYQCYWVRGHYNGYGYWIPSHRVCGY